jgi:hypothetical protein
LFFCFPLERCQNNLLCVRFRKQNGDRLAWEMILATPNRFGFIYERIASELCYFVLTWRVIQIDFIADVLKFI